MLILQMALLQLFKVAKRARDIQRETDEGDALTARSDASSSRGGHMDGTFLTRCMSPPAVISYGVHSHHLVVCVPLGERRLIVGSGAAGLARTVQEPAPQARWQATRLRLRVPGQTGAQWPNRHPGTFSTELNSPIIHIPFPYPKQPMTTTHSPILLLTFDSYNRCNSFH
jgi:hypothetical protein